MSDVRMSEYPVLPWILSSFYYPTVRLFRKRGAIINLSAGTASRPVPLLAVYTATKVRAHFGSFLPVIFLHQQSFLFRSTTDFERILKRKWTCAVKNAWKKSQRSKNDWCDRKQSVRTKKIERKFLVTNYCPILQDREFGKFMSYILVSDISGLFLASASLRVQIKRHHRPVPHAVLRGHAYDVIQQDVIQPQVTDSHRQRLR